MINITIDDGIAVVQLNRPKVNAINLELVQILQKSLADLKRDDSVGGVILTGLPGIFSGGLDVIDLFPRDREYISRFWTAFTELLYCLFTFPKPLFSAISGHSPAGGTVLAIMTDYRVMARGEFSLGLNEVAVGLILPASVGKVYQYLLGNRQAELLAVTGSLIPPEDALQVGLVDRLAEPGDVLDTAKSEMKRWLQLPAYPQNETRKQMRKEPAQFLQDCMQSDAETMTAIWFEPVFQKVMGKLVEKLTNR